MTIPIRRLVIIFAVLVLAYALFHPTKKEIRWDRAPQKETSLVKESDDMEGIISKLIECESGGNPNAYHPNDGDGTDSVGILQFKVKTFVHYALAYDLFPHAEAAELPNLWTGPDEQIKVAKEMIRRKRSNLYHWKNCSIKKGLI